MKEQTKFVIVSAVAGVVIGCAIIALIFWWRTGVWFMLPLTVRRGGLQ